MKKQGKSKVSQLLGFFGACACLLGLSGCGDQLLVEDINLALIYAMDRAPDKQMLVYEMSPVFNKEAKKKYAVYGAKAHTIRQAKDVFNSVAEGQVVVGKVQVLLFGEAFLREGIAPSLDVSFRDSKNVANMVMAAVKGSVSDLVNSNFPDKSILPRYITDSLQNSAKLNQGIETTLQEFHTLLYDKGITPAIVEVKKDKNGIVVLGSALLDKAGRQQLSLNRRENLYLLMLQHKANTPISYTISVPTASFSQGQSSGKEKKEGFVTMNIQQIRPKIETSYQDNQFVFTVNLEMDVRIIERTIPIDLEKEKDKLAHIIRNKMKGEIETLITKVQQKKLDPFGFGWHARAYQYPHWKKIQDQWPAEFSKARVNILPTINIESRGVIQ
ncbi:Ger(x)C family spore germination protein [Brevibacillus laterosporus]|uniref:Ger(X)C family spore germination protein n=1 Tax=Brevibacillus laterosporus TaxID=1465 RepID=A0AAP8QEI7_BRELA|nr:Ger(x)C family spore germination protein [Brevibacillus laterosporus]MED1662286.1 Ger(x)C family spore germination protein [Brevibacillus laterosporus]MED1670800.1 Ger(x)C family spore germination protein [Brevibacillus laterosporus]MED1720791.1 Ger(x)C family spore germination protein [Brevibacillus laterosporus]PPA81005.1 Ger(x)C family spore germination protein [Brevibacillus laterosporus]PPB08495.1 Ger(x)C family spore germination protein [Brevibacillus laterosporus]